MSNLIGIAELKKPSSKVLRPPGGGSSDIFGTDFSQTPRNNKNHMHSQIFSSGKNSAVKNNDDQPRRAQRSNDSYLHLFGEPNRPNTSAKNHMKSSIQFGQSDEAAQLLANGNGHHHFSEKNSSVSSTSSSISSSTENLKVNGAYKTDGNPVTGEGYKPGNDLNPSIPHLNGTNKIINKNRIPPGGFSSGLW